MVMMTRACVWREVGGGGDEESEHEPEAPQSRSLSGSRHASRSCRRRPSTHGCCCFSKKTSGGGLIVESE